MKNDPKNTLSWMVSTSLAGVVVLATLLFPTSTAQAQDDFSSVEHVVVQALSPEQAEAFSNGADPATIILSTGESLAAFIERLEATAGDLRDLDDTAKEKSVFQGNITIQHSTDPDKVLYIGESDNYAYMNSWESGSGPRNLSLFGSNVGINELSPSVTLDVAGGIGALNGFLVHYPTTGVYDNATSDSPYSRVDADSFHTIGLGVGQLFLEGRAIDSNTIIYISVGMAGGQAPQDVQIGDNRELFVDTSANSVGVGTSTPDEKLDVNGNIKLSGNILSDGDICIGSGC